MAIFQHKRGRMKLLLAIVVMYTMGFHMVQKSLELNLHPEYFFLHHIDSLSGGNRSTRVKQFKLTTIAIGVAITSKGVRNVTKNNIAVTFQLFQVFLPSFCQTASPGYEYKFYFAYDVNDPVFTNATLLAAFQSTFTNEMKRLCDDPRNITSSLHMVRCSHTGKPAWAQNDAMLEAYLDHVDFYYRVNDDTKMQTGGWVEAFIAVLNSYSPPLVGVVGPNHSGGERSILTYEFVHRTHVDIFGFYYPRIYADWFGDTWITAVYRPNRSTKVRNVTLAHTRELGRRYKPVNDRNLRKMLPTQLTSYVEILNR